MATLADIIASPSTRTPLTIGVFGTWGSGKTSLMRMVKQKLPADFRVAWFDAWKYEKEETVWRALLLQVLAALRAGIPKPKDEPNEAKKAKAEKKPLLIYDEAGKQVRWLMYRIEDLNVNEYYFMKGGMKQYFKSLRESFLKS